MEKQKYIYIGQMGVVVGGDAFDTYGQEAYFTEEDYRSIVERSPFIPAGDFELLDHTEDELKQFASPERRHLASADFLLKQREGLRLLHDIRTDLKKEQE